MDHSLSKEELGSIWKNGCNQPSWAQISQTSFDLKSFQCVKIRGALSEVAIRKIVPNWISYLHNFLDFSWLSIYFSCVEIFFGNFWKWKKGWRVWPTRQPSCCTRHPCPGQWPPYLLCLSNSPSFPPFHACHCASGPPRRLPGARTARLSATHHSLCCCHHRDPSARRSLDADEFHVRVEPSCTVR
jgi:hypothetical protein